PTTACHRNSRGPGQMLRRAAPGLRSRGVLASSRLLLRLQGRTFCPLIAGGRLWARRHQCVDEAGALPRQQRAAEPASPHDAHPVTRDTGPQMRIPLSRKALIHPLVPEAMMAARLGASGDKNAIRNPLAEHIVDE